MNFISNIQQRKTSNIVYSKDIKSLKEAIKDNKNNILPNNIVITSHNIDNVEKGFNQYNGTSYEMFYIDNNKNINRLSYNIQEGNGITVSDYKLYFGIDNETVKYQGSKKTLYIDNDNLRNAYYNYKGITKGDNEIYIDSFINNVKEYGTVSSIDGEISLNPGVMMEMREIAYYFNKYINLNDLIQQRIVDLLQGHIFNVGDILYRNEDPKATIKNELSFKQHNTYWKPYMICIIASNVMDDRYPRFIPIENHTIIDKPFLNSSNSILNTKSLYNKVPVYANDLFNITSDSEIEPASYGYIATNQANWGNNWSNPFYKTVEHYFANSSTDFNSELKWWIYQDNLHKYGKYSLEAGSIVTDSVEAEDDSTPGEFDITVNITFSDGFSSDYALTMAWDDDGQNFYNKYAVQPKKSYRTPLDDVKAHNEGEEEELNKPQNPYNFGSSKHLEPVPENLRGFIRDDEDIDFSKDDIIYQKAVEQEHMQVNTDHDLYWDDGGWCRYDDNEHWYIFPNEMYYGCGGGGCGSNSCAHCSCNCQYPGCSCDGYCGSNCPEHCNHCPCVSGVCTSFDSCPRDIPCPRDGLCPTNCGSDKQITEYTYTHISYTFGISIRPDLLEDDLECAYLKMYVTDGNINPNQYYVAKYNNSEMSYIFKKYNNPNGLPGGTILVMAYSSPNYADKPINIGQNNIVKYTLDKNDLINSKIFSFGNNIYSDSNNIIYGEGEGGNEGGEPTGDECTSDTGTSSTQIITCNSVYPQVISCSSVTISGCSSFNGESGSGNEGGSGNSNEGGSGNGNSTTILKSFKTNPTNKNMTIMKGKSKTITITTDPQNINCTFSWYFDNEENITIEKSANTKTCIIHGIKKTSKSIILTIQSVDYPELPKIYKNIDIVETEEEIIEDSTEEGGITIKHEYINYYKYTFEQIPFSFNLNNCLIEQIYKKTKSGNTIIRLMSDNGEVRNISINIPLQYFFLKECLIKNSTTNEYQIKKGFIVIIPDKDKYPDFNPDKYGYEIQVEAYFTPYKVKVNENTDEYEVGPSHITLRRFKLQRAKTKSSNSPVFITTTKTDITLTENQYNNLHLVKITGVYQNNEILYPELMKFGESVKLDSINIDEVSETVNEYK